MATTPRISLMGEHGSLRELAPQISASGDAPPIFVDDGILIGEKEQIVLLSLDDQDVGKFADFFERICEKTDWHVRLDWDDLDLMESFPYRSLDRPAGARESVPLWEEVPSFRCLTLNRES